VTVSPRKIRCFYW